MKVTILYGGHYNRLSGINKEVFIVEEGFSLKQLLDLIRDKHGDIIINEIKSRRAILLLNGRSVSIDDCVELKEDDFISILPPVTGG
ncbi:MAG: MoaD/ThiS family protein [Caldisphaeraceae archaeon]|nr:MoaD/ThiS family protein [Caldisphaeraceae archaeon]